MDDNFDMGSLPTLENLDGSTEEPVATRSSSNYSSAQNSQNTIPQNAYRQNNYNPVNQNNGYQQNNYSPVNQNNGYQQNNFNPVNQNFQQYNNMPNNNFTQRSANTLDSFWSEHEENCRRGEKITKVIGIILLILSILGVLLTFVDGKYASLIGSGIRIYCIFQFINGKNAARIYMIVIMFLSSIFCLISYAIFDTLYASAEQSIDFSVIGFLQGIYIIGVLLYGGVGVFLIVSKSIKAYFSR